MKIDDTRKIHRTRSSVRAAPGQSAVAAARTSIIDKVEWRGIPDAELTPKVRKALTLLLEEVRDLRAELQDAQKQLTEMKTLADRDPMLDVLNRRAFTRELDRALAMIDRYDVRSSLVFVDVNDLKKINDGIGHNAGDAALTHVATTISNSIRQADVFARLGGDEFAILLIQVDEAIATNKATQIASLIAETPVEWDGAPFPVSVSWGAIEIRKGVSAQEALNLADEAMYEAKRNK